MANADGMGAQAAFRIGRRLLRLVLHLVRRKGRANPFVIDK